MVGLTAVPQSEADAAAAEWAIDFPLVADPSCSLVLELNRRGLLKSTVEMDPEIVGDENSFFAQNVGGGRRLYERGMLQPGTVALRGPADKPEVLLTWGSVPSAANVRVKRSRVNPSYYTIPFISALYTPSLPYLHLCTSVIPVYTPSMYLKHL